MIIKFLSLMAVIAALTAGSAPAFAADEATLAPDTMQNDAAVTNPDAALPPRCEPWMRDCRPQCQPWERDCNRGGAFVCYARNITGRTFQAVGNFRTPREFVAQRALENCRESSFFPFRRTCRFIGCRMLGFRR